MTQSEEEKANLIIGLAAGIGGFTGLLILLVCIWKVCCGSLCKEEQPKRYKINSIEEKQNINLKRAQEMIEKNKLKKQILSEIRSQRASREDMYH